MRRPPFDDRMSQPARPVDVDDPFSHHFSIGERDEAHIAVEPRVDHERPRETRVNRTHVAKSRPDMFGRRVDDEVFANRSHDLERAVRASRCAGWIRWHQALCQRHPTVRMTSDP
jgi:hypothetical protein